ncbi:MAG: SRPBCC family protein [Acidimicrobiia bacterium]
MTNAVVQQALSRLDAGAPPWKTLVVLASAETDLLPAAIWQTWSEIEEWPSMSSRVLGARWTKGQPWRAGSEFTQELDLGFPFGTRFFDERVVAIEPGISAEWGQTSRALQTIHLWRFEPRDTSGTRITNVEVFHGFTVGVAGAMVAPRWRRHFQEHVDELIKTAKENS